VELDSELRRATTILERCAKAMPRIPLEPSSDHIKSIGQAMVNVFEIQKRIYELRPELIPNFLKNKIPSNKGQT
jgi:hypothetical protein